MRRHTLPVLAATSVLVLAAAGCDLIDGSAGPYRQPSAQPPGGGPDSGGATSGGSDSGGTSGGPPSAPETYSPDAMGEVVGNNCQYDRSVNKINYEVSIQNASTTQAFRYQIAIEYSGGDNPFSDDSFGAESLTVTVAPGAERKMTVAHYYELSNTKRQYYGCNISSATKMPAS